ncbi:hypothetical protein EMPS_02969 [Entomortierella parvispora]|uniref:Prolyl endopeptidase-like n=1 Tax=Entomortierella parvispora TaxID=205924 RepID=A0A9P3H5S2_9FUNG|nr:hypothetical protein EMPS_02969 [Entomortierella parvispora]
MPRLSPGLPNGEGGFKSAVDSPAFPGSPSLSQHIVDSPITKSPQPTLPSKAKRIPRPLTLHNETLIDNYHWMHQLGQDPDVAAYIQEETDYTNQWIEQNGVASLQNQLEWEMRQIQRSIDHLRCSSAFATDEDSGNPPWGMKKECLETSEFWDLDRWRYWLDTSVGEYGVYKRRSLLMATADSFQTESEYFAKMDTLQQQYMALSPLMGPPLDVDDLQDGENKIQESKRRSYLPDQPLEEHYDDEQISKANIRCKPQSKVEIVLDVNRLAEKVKKTQTNGLFSFGAIEVQPYRTVFRSANINGTFGNKDGKCRPRLVAYSYDVTGNERYHIRITTIPCKASKSGFSKIYNNPNLDFGLTNGFQSSELLNESKTLQYTGCTPSLSAVLHQGENEDAHQGSRYCSYETWDIKDAGPETRWVRLGSSLYLYYTKLDRKGLQREVWRVKVESCHSHSSLKYDQAGTSSYNIDGKQNTPHHEPKSELVMRENDERYVLSLFLTNDQRFVIIESTGQTSSHSYFLSVDYQEQGWHLIRQGEEDVIYKVEHHGGYFYLRTNLAEAYNFKVIRIPVQFYFAQKHDAEDCCERLAIGAMRQRTVTFPTATKSKLETGAGDRHDARFLASRIDDTVVDHVEDEYLERFEVFVQHFVAWIWREGLQEFRVFLAPESGSTDKSKMNNMVSLKELRRVRPYHPDFKIAAVMPSNIRYEEQRLMREFFTTRLRYSNSSFVHPWAIYELDMHLLSLVSEVQHMESSQHSGRIQLEDVTRLVHQDPFPIGIQYGKPPTIEMQSESKWQAEFLATYKDKKKEQENEMAKFTERRIMVPSTHGALSGIPISVVYYSSHRSSVPGSGSVGPDFPRPGAFVTSYGAYGTLTVPSFDPTAVLPLLHRGLIYVMVHPRGDGVLGPSWYEGGKILHKRNTFYDVEDVLKYLRDSGMILPESVVIQGRSAGGLVSGWMANRWGNSPAHDPVVNQGAYGNYNIVKEMVKVVLAQVPFMDVITDMADPDIPWVEYEWNEWGSPLHSREVFEVMKQYSPYDCIRNQPYPAMMIMGGLTDSRVSYAEPLKYVAKLRSVEGKMNVCHVPTADTRPIFVDQIVLDKVERHARNNICANKEETPLLLRIEDGGHFSGSPSLWMAFAVHQLGAEKVVAEHVASHAPVL